MTLNEIIEWARANGIDFDAVVEMGDTVNGLGPITDNMLDRRGDNGLDISTDY